MEVILLASFPQFINSQSFSEVVQTAPCWPWSLHCGGPAAGSQQTCLHIKWAGDLEYCLGSCLCHCSWEAELVWESLEGLIWERKDGVDQPVFFSNTEPMRRHSVIFHTANLSDYPTWALFAMTQSLRGAGTSWSVGVPREKWISKPVIGKEKSKLPWSWSLNRNVFNLPCWMPEGASLCPFLWVWDFPTCPVS